MHLVVSHARKMQGIPKVSVQLEKFIIKNNRLTAKMITTVLNRVTPRVFLSVK